MFAPGTFPELGLPGDWYAAVEFQYPPHLRQGAYEEEGRCINTLKARRPHSLSINNRPSSSPGRRVLVLASTVSGTFTQEWAETMCLSLLQLLHMMRVSLVSLFSATRW